ncbi:hypothetical protein RDSD_001123 [Oleidesulfovibrio alaskensis]
MRLRGFETRNKAGFQAMACMFHKVYLLRKKRKLRTDFLNAGRKHLPTVTTFLTVGEFDGDHGLDTLLAISGNRYHFGNGSREYSVILDLGELTRPRDTERITHMARREVRLAAFSD